MQDRYVIVRADGTLFRTRKGKELYANEGAAKAAVTRHKDPTLRVLARQEYLANRPMRKVRNLMSGKEVEIPEDEVGGPCDPSMERYWTM